MKILLGPHDGYDVVLTADRTLMTCYGGISFIGFLACLPKRLVNDFLLHHFLYPEVPSKNGKAVFAPYALRKVEACLLNNGFDDSEVVVARPSDLRNVVGSKTRVVGIYAVDPLGYSPVSWTLCNLFGGFPSCTAAEFERLLNSPVLKSHRNHLKIIVGGPGVWQISQEKAEQLGISTLFVGEGDNKVAADMFRKAVNGENLPPVVYGKQTKLEEIPRIVRAERVGYVQITRGCGRGCKFCSVTKGRWISIPKQMVLDEVKVNLRAGIKGACFITEDGLRYGAKGLNINREAVMDLFKSTLAISDGVGFSHASFPTIVQAPDLVYDLTELLGLERNRPMIGPQIGLETGSPRLIRKYMAGKPRPYKPEDWPHVVVEAMQILNENYWYPCVTLVVGLPDENEGDITKTIELIDELKDCKGWFFPLFFAAMGETALQEEKSFTLEKMTETHWELFFKCWELSIRFSKEIIDYMFKFAGNTIARTIIRSLLKKGINVADRYFNEARKDPTKTIESLKKVDLNVPQAILKFAISSTVGLSSPRRR